MQATISRTVLTVDGIRAPLLEARPPDAPTDEAIVFVHGNPGSSQDWVPLLERAGHLARAVAWDHPGFGQADKPASFDYTVDGYAAHLGRCLDTLGVARAHLVGHDFGGPWMLRWAAGHPDRFASATLINTGVLPDYRWHYLARIWRTPVLGERVRAQHLAGVLASQGHLRPTGPARYGGVGERGLGQPTLLPLVAATPSRLLPGGIDPGDQRFGGRPGLDQAIANQ